MLKRLFNRTERPTVANAETPRDLLAAARAERLRRRSASSGSPAFSATRDSESESRVKPEVARGVGIHESAALAHRPDMLPQPQVGDVSRFEQMFVVNPRDIIGEIPPNVLGFFSAQFARESGLLPFRQDGEHVLWIATARPVTRLIEQQTRWVIGLSGADLDVRFARAERDLLDRAIDVHYPEARSAGLATESITQLATIFGADTRNSSGLGTFGPGLTESPRGLVEHVLCLAVERRATDIFIDTWDSELVVRFKIDGSCETALSGLPAHAGPQLVSVVKQMARLKIYETEVQQSGGYEATVMYGDKPRRVEFRVEVTPTLFGESCSIRLHDAQSRSLRLDAIGADSRTLKALDQMVRTRRGMLVLSGPTESGKTTTLYSILGEIDLSRENVVAIEDPVEIRMRGVRPIQVNEVKGVTFASSLRSVLRQNPDRILVGEIRDRETADLAVFAALTGHQVLTTAHADDAPRTIVRLIKAGIEPHNIASILDLVIAQRLVGRVCSACAEPVIYDRGVLLAAQFAPEEIDHVRASRGRGCKLCRWSGIDGRRALYETLVVTDQIRACIENGGSGLERDVRDLAIDGGMRPLRRAGLDYVRSGDVCLEQVLLMTPPMPDAYAGEMR